MIIYIKRIIHTMMTMHHPLVQLSKTANGSQADRHLRFVHNNNDDLIVQFRCTPQPPHSRMMIMMILDALITSFMMN